MDLQNTRSGLYRPLPETAPVPYTRGDLREAAYTEIRKPDVYHRWRRTWWREVWDVLEDLAAGEKFPEIELNVSEIARRIGKDRKIVQRALQVFDDFNLIEFVKREPGRPGIYRIVWDFTYKLADWFRRIMGGCDPTDGKSFSRFSKGTTPVEKDTEYSVTNESNKGKTEGQRIYDSWQPIEAALKNAGLDRAIPSVAKAVWKVHRENFGVSSFERLADEPGRLVEAVARYQDKPLPDLYRLSVYLVRELLYQVNIEHREREHRKRKDPDFSGSVLDAVDNQPTEKDRQKQEIKRKKKRAARTLEMLERFGGSGPESEHNTAEPDRPRDADDVEDLDTWRKKMNEALEDFAA